MGAQIRAKALGKPRTRPIRRPIERKRKPWSLRMEGLAAPLTYVQAARCEMPPDPRNLSHGCEEQARPPTRSSELQRSAAGKASWLHVGSLRGYR